MKLYRNAYCFLQRLYKLVCVIGTEKSRHILDTDGISSHTLKSLGVIFEIIGGIDLARGIAYCRLNVTALALCGVYGSFEISGIVERIENSQYIDSVSNRLLNEIFDHVVGVVTVAEDVLSAEEHLKLCILYVRTNCTKSLPGIFVKETKAGVEGSASPSLKRMIADAIKLFENRKHLLGCHSRSYKRLMRVTKYCFCYFYLCHLSDLH